MSAIVRRRDAAQATLDRFRDRPFRFGRYDCVRLAAFHLRQLGHRPQLARAGSYASALAARRALERAGHRSVAEAVDALLPRIAPATALVGDIVQMDAEDDLGGLAVLLGGGRAIGYHQDLVGAGVLQPVAIAIAWRADPR